MTWTLKLMTHYVDIVVIECLLMLILNVMMISYVMVIVYHVELPIIVGLLGG